MKKTLIVCLFASLLLTACSENSSVTEQSSESVAEQSSESVAEQSSEYDPFAVSGGNATDDVTGAYSYGVEQEDGKVFILDAAPTVSFRYYVENDADDNDFGILLYVNGYSQPYRTEEDNENKTMHIFDVKQNEKKVQTIEFEPVSGKKGDELYVEIVPMFHPSYVQKGSAYAEFYHRIATITPTKLSVTQESGLTEPKVCTEYEATPISDELRMEFNAMGSSGSTGGNSLDEQVYLEALKNDVLYTPKDIAAGNADAQPSFTLNDSLTLCMLGFKSYKYRVAMYINHELVPEAFDGADYIDMMPSQDVMCKKKIDLKKLNLSLEDYNNLYFVAVPLYTDETYDKDIITIKSNTVSLMRAE